MDIMVRYWNEDNYLTSQSIFRWCKSGGCFGEIRKSWTENK